MSEQPEFPNRPWLERDRRPAGVSDDTVSAVGKFGEALGWVERARGHLYDFHQMMGHADGLIGDAVEALHDADHHELAARINAPTYAGAAARPVYELGQACGKGREDWTAMLQLLRGI